MKVRSKSILVFQNNMDLQHLGTGLGELDIATRFESAILEFSQTCTAEKFDLIIVSAVSEASLTPELIEIVSGSVNFHTPLLVILDNNPEIIREVVGRQYDFMIFPFGNEEFTGRIEQILRRSETEEIIHQNIVRLRSIYDNLPVGVAQTDQSGSFIFLNNEFSRILGQSEGNILKENFFRLCHPDDYFIERKQLDRLLKKETQKVSFEIRLINNDGRTSVCRIIASGIWKDADRFTSYLFVVEKVS